MNPFPAHLYTSRRVRLFNALATEGADVVFVIPAAPAFLRNGDVEHDYRQDSDFFYLTGFAEPQSVLVLTLRDRKMTLFVRPRNPERERWDGPRLGLEGAKAVFGAHEAFDYAQLDQELPRLLENQVRLFYRLGMNRALDDRVLAAVEKVRRKERIGIAGPMEIIEPGKVIHEMRLIKEQAELDTLQKAARITHEGHTRVMATVRSGLHEYELEALLLETFRKHGSERPAYQSIVGSGPNATVLHYRAGRRKLEAGELVLVDAGCEYDSYASDVTRTFPVNGRFSWEQQAIYELVLEAQLASIANVRKGATLNDVHRASVEVITAGLVRLGILSGEVDALIEKGAYKAFFMHRTSHWLGMDVHDVGAYHLAGKPRPLEPGMVITVEPGIYIDPLCDAVAPSFRGIGVRIEDDIVVTDSEPLNLTAGIPKTVDEVERACSS